MSSNKHTLDLYAYDKDVAEFLGDTKEVIEKTYYHSCEDKRLEKIKNVW